MNYKTIVDGLMVLENLLSNKLDVDAIIFDCDGTLVDVSESQYLSVKLTSSIILEKLYGIEIFPGREFDEAIYMLKMLGGFNNMRDIAMLLTQWIFLDIPSAKMIKDDLGRVDLDEYIAKVTSNETSPKYVRDSLNKLVNWGLNKLGEYVSKSQLFSLIEHKARELQREQALKDLRVKLGPRRPYGAGILTTLFSEIYFGSDEVVKLYGSRPRYVNTPGLIKQDKVIVTEDSLQFLDRKVSKGLAIITGRSRRLTEITLKPFLKYFRIDASMFTSDLPEAYEKPSPRVLIECQERLGARRVLYVGDGGEDLFLVKNVIEKGSKALFAGVLTNKFSDQLFPKLEADIIASDVNKLVELFKKG